VSAFKATRKRFAKACHDLTRTTEGDTYKHLGPGYYDIENDPNRPTLEQTELLNNYSPMKDSTPRFGHCAYALTTENQKPGREHISPGMHIEGHGTFIRKTTLKEGKCAFFMSKTQPRLKGRTQHQKMMDSVANRFDHTADQNRHWGKTGAFISRQVRVRMIGHALLQWMALAH